MPRNKKTKNRNDVSVRPLFPAPVSGIASLLVPGLGQILNRQVGRGILIILSLTGIIALFISRMVALAPRLTGSQDIFLKAIGRRPFFLILVLLATIAAWLWTAWDAYRSAKLRRKSGAIGLFAAIIVAFFALGWQISEIDLGKMVTEAPKAWGPLSKVLWPWEAGITYKDQTVSADAKVLIGTEFPAPLPNEKKSKEPYLIVEPTRGELSRVSDSNQMIPGTVLHLSGGNFRPNTRTEIWWIDPIGNEFQPREGGKYVSVTTDAAGAFETSFAMPYQLVPPSAKGPQYDTAEARQVSRSGPPLPSDALKLTVARMVETIMMGMMATFFGILFSIPIAFLASRNIMSGSWVTMAIYFLTRTILNIVRSIEPLIWALIAVVWVGLGPFAGIIALTLHSVAALGKLYSEAIEGIDHGPIEAIQATGAGRLQTIMYAVIPQMISPFISFSIYRWDINVRMSTIIGVVGGGGIGFILFQYIRLLQYREAGIAVWFIAITVAILDYVSAEIRNRLL
ncbi:MAG TPA: phosphonate ABC transporter, permease protein PhnE [Spirochaetia bacterium]|nr:phosphonate ABC transporter, permease protein PhnE [Spirochaetia bacterium]